MKHTTSQGPFPPCSKCGCTFRFVCVDRQKKTGIARWCCVCRRAAGRTWRRRNPAKMREYKQRYRADDGAERRSHLHRYYKLSAKDYEALRGIQANRCLICHVEAEPGVRLHVDHCHDCGAVRGLLCFKCNLAIGLLRDDVGLLRDAIYYLRPHTSEHDHAHAAKGIAALKRRVA